MATLEEMEAALQEMAPSEEGVAKAPIEGEPDTGFLSTLSRPIKDIYGYASALQKGEPLPPLPIWSLLQAAGLLYGPTRGFTARSMLGGAAGSQLGGPTGEVLGGLAGGFGPSAAKGIYSKLSSLRGIPISQLLKRAIGIKGAPTVTPEALLGETAGAGPTIEQVLGEAAEVAKGRLGAELVQPVASAGPASAAVSSAANTEASKFIGLIRANPDLRHTLFQPDVLQDLMNTVKPLLAKGEKAENVFAQLYGRGTALKEQISGAVSKANEVTKLMDMSRGQIQAGSTTAAEVQKVANDLALQGKNAEEMYQAIFGRQAPGLPLVSGR